MILARTPPLLCFVVFTLGCGAATPRSELPDAGSPDAGALRCGNGTLETDEVCEGFELRQKSCASEGFEGGTLRCSSTCKLDYAECFKCGDGRISGPERCEALADGGVDFGGRTCASELDAGAVGELQCANGCRSFSTAGCFVPPARNQPCSFFQGCAPGLFCDLVQVSPTTFRCQAHCPAAAIGTASGCAASESCQDGGVELQGASAMPPSYVTCPPAACAAEYTCLQVPASLNGACAKPVGICR